MPTPFIFFQRLPNDVTSSLLTYLPLANLEKVARTSKNLQTLIADSTPASNQCIDKDSQMYVEYAAIQKGYRILQQSHLPLWLKDRWGEKGKILQAISQGFIGIPSALSTEATLKPSVDAIHLRKTWIGCTLSIDAKKRFNLDQPLYPVIDNISLKALYPDYSITFIINNICVENQKISLAFLELIEIFLSTDCAATCQEGLLALQEFPDCLMLNQFLSPYYIMKARNDLLGIEPNRYVEDSDDDFNDEEKAMLLQAYEKLLSPVGLLMLAEELLPLEKFTAHINHGLNAILLTRPGLTALRNRFISLDQVYELYADDPEKIFIVVSLLQCLLTESSLVAVDNNLLSFCYLTPQEIDLLKARMTMTIGVIQQEQFLTDTCKKLLTTEGLNLIHHLSIDLTQMTTCAQWHDLLTHLTQHASLTANVAYYN